MKKSNTIVYSGITWIVVSLSVLCFGSLDVTFFDVGQGNCSLVGSSDIKNLPPLLVDCGSNSYRFKKDKNFKKNQIESLVAKIESYTKQHAPKEIIIVISHPDTDHYNWIPDVIDECEEREIEVKSIFLGGLEKYYSKVFKSCLTRLKKKSNDKDFVKSQEQLSATKNPITIVSRNEIGLKCSILPPLTCTKKSEANDASLVVWVQYGDASCLLTGDATKTTTIYNLKRVPNLRADIIQASHHGAAAEDCNNIAWIQKLEPSFVVLSSGFHGHGHPRSTIVRRFIDCLPDSKDGECHSLYSGTKHAEDRESLDFHAINSEGYGISSTGMGISGTLGQGDITFVLEGNNGITLPQCSIGTQYPDKKTDALANLMNPLYETFNIEFLKLINLSNLKIDDSPTTDGPKIYLFIKLLINKAEALKKVFLNNNKLNGLETFELLVSLLEKRPKIRIFQIRGNNLSVEQQKALEDVWKHRGLDWE